MKTFSFIIRPVSLLGCTYASVRPAGSVLASLHGNPALWLLSKLESPQHRSHFPKPERHIQGYRGPLEVGRQCRRRQRWKWDVWRLGLCWRYQPRRGGGEERWGYGVPSGCCGVEGLSLGSPAVWDLRWRSADVWQIHTVSLMKRDTAERTTKSGSCRRTACVGVKRVWLLGQMLFYKYM